MGGGRYLIGLVVPRAYNRVGLVKKGRKGSPKRRLIYMERKKTIAHKSPDHRPAGRWCRRRERTVYKRIARNTVLSYTYVRVRKKVNTTAVTYLHTHTHTHTYAVYTGHGIKITRNKTPGRCCYRCCNTANFTYYFSQISPTICRILRFFFFSVETRRRVSN